MLLLTDNTHAAGSAIRCRDRDADNALQPPTADGWRQGNSSLSCNCRPSKVRLRKHGCQVGPRKANDLDEFLSRQTGAYLEFRAERSADETGRLLVFEPQVDSDDRLVLLTNGMIGSMRTEEIRLAVRSQEPSVAEH